MYELLKVNIRQFNDEGEFNFIGDDGTLDIDGVISAFESGQADDTGTDTDDSIGTDDSTRQGTEEEHNGDLDHDSVETDEGDLAESPTDQETASQDTQKRTPDQAFAEMRRKAEQYEKTAKWVQDLAVQQGFQSPDELIKAYEEQRIAKEAQEQGVPVDVYKRLHELESENKRTKEEMIASRFNNEVQQVVDKYNLNDDQLQDVFRYMGERGYDAGDIPFEDAYILANRDTILKEAEERGREKYLESLQRKQKQATPAIKGSPSDAPPGGDELDYSKEGIFATLDKMGISYD